jgi:WD40 repeat protein
MNMKNQHFRVFLAVFILSFSYGCSSTDAPQTEAPPAVDANTPVNAVISSATIDSITLIDSFSASNSRILDLDLSSDGAWLAYSAQDRTITLWEVENRQTARIFPMRSIDMADLDISPGDQFLATGEMIWDLQTGEEIHVLELGSPFPAYVVFSPDGAYLTLGLHESEITVWDVASGEPIVSFPEEEDNRTKAIVISPDGTLLAVGVIDGSIRIYDVEQAQMVNQLHHPAETDIHDLAISPDGNYLAAAGRFHGVLLWDLRSGEVVRTFRVHDDSYSVAISPDGTILAAGGGQEEAVLLWDIESGQLLRTLPMENKSMALAFSGDGRILVAGDFDGQIYIWGIPTAP